MAELDPRRWKALAVVCAAFFMTILDVSIVNVALPSIGKSLDFSRDDLQWVITAYAITFGGFLLLGGRAADLLGRRRVFLVGVVVFTVASFFCGLAWSEGVLIARARRPGLRRRDHHTGRALDHHDDVRGGRRAQQGARHLGRDRRLGRRGRRARRRRPDEVRSAGSGSSSSTCRSACSRSCSRPRFVRESRARARDRRRTRRRRHGHRRPRAARLRGLEGAGPRLGLGWTISRLAAVGRCCSIAFLVIESRAKDPLMPFTIFRVRTVAGANVAGLLLGAVSSRTSSSSRCTCSRSSAGRR